MNESAAKRLLLIAGAFGIAVGFMMLIGGLFVANDACQDSIPNTYDYYVMYGKYWCGMIRHSPNDSVCTFTSLDHGWFKRVHEAETGYIDTTRSKIDREELKKLVGYKGVMSSALVCGLGWAASGVLALVAAFMKKKRMALISGLLFSALYILFIVLFALVWNSVHKVHEDCKFVYENACDDFKSQVTRSAREYLIYSICAFILILVSIVCCFVYVYSVTEQSTKGEDKAGDEKAVDLPTPTENTNVFAHGIEMKGEPTPVLAFKEEFKAEPKVPPIPEKKKEIDPAASYRTKFSKVNKYLLNEKNLRKHAEKKFAVTDVEKLGKLTTTQLRKVLNTTLGKKTLPLVPDDKLEAIIRKCNSTKGGEIDRESFEELLFESYVKSRELLIKNYAEYKAGVLKKTLSQPATLPDFNAIYTLTEDPNALYSELSALSEEVDMAKSMTLGEEEVEILLGLMCEKYRLVKIGKEEIGKIMTEMERPVTEYTLPDLRMAALAVFCIAKNIALSSQI